MATGDDVSFSVTCGPLRGVCLRLRDAALALDTVEQLSTVAVHTLGREASFEDIPRANIAGGPWDVAWTWTQSAHIHLRELSKEHPPSTHTI